jgi:DNA-directed RNA polymerase subunit M/transcription elongation factor TFIIS
MSKNISDRAHKCPKCSNFRFYFMGLIRGKWYQRRKTVLTCVSCHNVFYV